MKFQTGLPFSNSVQVPLAWYSKEPLACRQIRGSSGEVGEGPQGGQVVTPEVFQVAAGSFGEEGFLVLSEAEGGIQFSRPPCSCGMGKSVSFRTQG